MVLHRTAVAVADVAVAEVAVAEVVAVVAKVAAVVAVGKQLLFGGHKHGRFLDHPQHSSPTPQCNHRHHQEQQQYDPQEDRDLAPGCSPGVGLGALPLVCSGVACRDHMKDTGGYHSLNGYY